MPSPPGFWRSETPTDVPTGTAGGCKRVGRVPWTEAGWHQASPRAQCLWSAHVREIQSRICCAVAELPGDLCRRANRRGVLELRIRVLF